MLNRPNHPLAGSSGLIPEYRVVLYDHIGAGPHPCHWCGQLIDWMPGAGCSKGALVVDHVDYDWRNNDISNLVPACQGCNGSRSRRISDDEPHIVRPNGERVRGEWRSCEFCEVRFVAYRNKDKRRGRFCSMSCARKFDHRKRKAS